ncbi:IMP dehydrogenase, partial [Candidatus Wolfebacteria bacterium]|nr:IMP dehydrogenase [Candidatus Wolfebacteria bacterium]
GVLHYNYATIDEQIEEAKRVKSFEAAFVKNPVCLSPKNTVGDVYKVNEKYGFFSVLITENGTLNSRLAGIVTRRDVRYLRNMNVPLKNIMTPKGKLITANRKNTLDARDIEAANKIIRKNNLDTLPIVDAKFYPVALVTDSDLRKNTMYPLATKDSNKQLRVFIAVESRMELAKERIKKGYEAGVDGIVIDAGIVYKSQLEITEWAKKNFPRLEVVAGNIASPMMLRNILKSNAKYIDAIRIGVGPGAGCITQQELGTGRAQASAVYYCAEEAKKLSKKYGHVPVIADGGVKILDGVGNDFKRPADITKAIALGGDTVMIGSMLAGLEEAPGEKQYDEAGERMIKKYRGMGSPEAMRQRAGVRYGVDKVKVRVAEGKEIKVPYRGSGYDFIPYLIAGIKQSFQKQGFRNIAECHKYADIRPLPR